ncbi:hypothetical protein C8Q78DRAFT_991100 [Trametes maxima]|nr:hypothetical protein C8Q78DRAFT_991100 [Trametes maxima]
MFVQTLAVCAPMQKRRPMIFRTDRAPNTIGEDAPANPMCFTYDEIAEHAEVGERKRRLYYWDDAFDEWSPVLGRTHGIDIEPHMRMSLLRLEGVDVCPGFDQALARLQNHQMSFKTSLADAEQAVNEATIGVPEREIGKDYVLVVYWGQVGLSKATLDTGLTQRVQVNGPAQVWQQPGIRTPSSRPGCVLGAEGYGSRGFAADLALKIWETTICDWIKVERGEPGEVSPISRNILVRGHNAEKLSGLGVQIALLHTQPVPDYDVGAKRLHAIDDEDVYGTMQAILAVYLPGWPYPALAIRKPQARVLAVYMLICTSMRVNPVGAPADWRNATPTEFDVCHARARPLSLLEQQRGWCEDPFVDMSDQEYTTEAVANTSVGNSCPEVPAICHCYLLCKLEGDSALTLQISEGTRPRGGVAEAFMLNQHAGAARVG